MRKLSWFWRWRWRVGFECAKSEMRTEQMGSDISKNQWFQTIGHFVGEARRLRSKYIDWWNLSLLPPLPKIKPDSSLETEVQKRSGTVSDWAEIRGETEGRLSRQVGVSKVLKKSCFWNPALPWLLLPVMIGEPSRGSMGHISSGSFSLHRAESWLDNWWLGRTLDQALPEGGDQLYNSSPKYPDTGLLSGNAW